MNSTLLRVLLVVILLWRFVQATLLYSPASVLQITVSLSAPIELPDRKLFWDWGLQMNYDLPFNLEQFHSAPIWPGKFNKRERRVVLSHYKGIEADLKYENMNAEVGKHPSDFTAGELYHNFENLLLSYGFHETCLLRSVCELAHHPFSDDHQNILTDILTFILTPSLHAAFSPSEHLYREVYEEAERRGFLQYNCAELYCDCKQDLLTSITNVVTTKET